MMRSLFAGVSGLKNHQTRMDAIGNNIANVNTPGYKASRVQFQDVLSQTLQGSSAGGAGRGGTNPMQVGLGMGLASIDTIFTDGSFQPTGKQTDLSIQGQGFFVLSDDPTGANKVYTRAGNFDFDRNGNFLVPGTGFLVQGWMADGNGQVNTTGNTGPIKIPVGQNMDPQDTDNVFFGNNLNAEEKLGKPIQGAIKVYDSLGIAHKITTTFTRIGDGQWAYSVDVPNADNVSGQYGVITFKSNGTIDSIKSVTPDPALNVVKNTIDFTGLKLDSTEAAGTAHTYNLTVMDSSNRPRCVELSFTKTATGWDYKMKELGVENENASSGSIATADLPISTLPTSLKLQGETTDLAFHGSIASGTASGPSNIIPGDNVVLGTKQSLTFNPINPVADPMEIALNFDDISQYGNETTFQILDADGYPAGQLDGTVIDPSGIIIGKFTNGQNRVLAQVALATFNNAGGLTKVGSNLFAQSTNSGEAQIGTSGSGGRGDLNPGSLEMSNVDLAQEFSNMIITQRGFQANSKIISVTDEMLQELANLKR